MPVNMKYGHWAHLDGLRIDAGIKLIRKVEEYNGEEYLVLGCTQLDNHTAAEQTRVVNSWCELFRSQQLPARIIWFETRMSQKIVDAVCHLEKLEGLWIKWGVYPDVSNLRQLQNLQYLHLGGGSSIPDISSVATLTRLKCFEALHLYKISDYSFLSQLKGIDDLTIEGDPYSAMKKVELDSLQFLEEMPQMQRLELCMLKIKDHSYLPITKLSNLKSLSLPRDKDLDKDLAAFQQFKSIMQ
jgi:hypothetical protein